MAWIIDPSHSDIQFSVKHMMIATVRGRFTKFNGTFNVNDRNLLQSSVEGTAEAASVDTRDSNRDAHLRSADFFDAENYPVLAFRSTGIRSLGGGRYEVAGELTIKDITRPVVFEVTDEGRGKDPWGNMRFGVSATTTINRKDFELNWNAALETGGVLVGDNVKINAELELIYQPDTAPEPEVEAMAVAA
jgi:polyisoprenoid-binding protein YceI